MIHLKEEPPCRETGKSANNANASYIKKNNIKSYPWEGIIPSNSTGSGLSAREIGLLEKT